MIAELCQKLEALPDGAFAEIVLQKHKTPRLRIRYFLDRRGRPYLFDHLASTEIQEYGLESTFEGEETIPARADSLIKALVFDYEHRK